MPNDDLLRHVIGPTAYSPAWLWLALFVATVLVLWYAGVFLFTGTDRRLRDVPLVAAATDRIIRRRFARSVRQIGDRHRRDEIGYVQAGAAISGQLRRFLHLQTGLAAEYMQLRDFAHGELAPAASLLEQLIEVQFNDASEVDVSQVSEAAEELIRSWV